MYQEISWVITLILVALLGAVFIAVVKSTAGTQADYASIQKRTAGLRYKSFLLTLLVIVPIIGYTLTKMPYPRAPVAASKTVDVTGYQWYWQISDATAKAGETVLYRVTSADVNHGFAIYDPAMQVIAQTQAMPGYTNRLLVTYPRAGAYRVLCLEYCGLAHHAMLATIDVSE